MKKLLKRLVNRDLYHFTTTLYTPACTSLLSHSQPHIPHTFNPPTPHTHPNPSLSFTHTQELQRRREEELSSLQEQLAELTAQLEALDLNMRKYTTGLQQMVERQNQRETRNKEEEEAYRVKKRTFDLLPNAEDNIAKLQVHSIQTLNHPITLPSVLPASPPSLLFPLFLFSSPFISLSISFLFFPLSLPSFPSLPFLSLSPLPSPSPLSPPPFSFPCLQ